MILAKASHAPRQQGHERHERHERHDGQIIGEQRPSSVPAGEGITRAAKVAFNRCPENGPWYCPVFRAS